MVLIRGNSDSKKLEKRNTDQGLGLKLKIKLKDKMNSKLI